MKIVSGGQTGVDRAALDVAAANAIDVGGWCPAGRTAEDGIIPAHYPLVETADADVRQRTEWNVRDSDATLILSRQSNLKGGTRLTAVFARRLRRPLRIHDPARPHSVSDVAGWLHLKRVETLNIAGPRESEDPGIYDLAFAYLQSLLDLLTALPSTASRR